MSLHESLPLEVVPLLVAAIVLHNNSNKPNETAHLHDPISRKTGTSPVEIQRQAPRRVRSMKNQSFRRLLPMALVAVVMVPEKVDREN